jgi:hypothetical protein
MILKVVTAALTVNLLPLSGAFALDASLPASWRDFRSDQVNWL